MAQLKDLIVNGPSRFIGNANFSNLIINTSATINNAFIESATVDNNIYVGNRTITNSLTTNSATITNLTANNISSTTATISYISSTTATISYISVTTATTSKISAVTAAISYISSTTAAITYISATKINTKSLTSTTATINSLTSTTANIMNLTTTYITIKSASSIGFYLNSTNTNVTTIGTSSKPIYWSSGHAATITNLNLSSGTITANAINTTTISVSGISVTNISFNDNNGYGSSTLPIYWNNGKPTAVTGINLSAGTITANTISTTKLTTTYITVTSASSIGFYTSSTPAGVKTFGSSSKPIYWNSGKPAAISNLSITTITANTINATTINATTINATTINATTINIKSSFLMNGTSSIGSSRYPIYLENGQFKEGAYIPSSGGGGGSETTHYLSDYIDASNNISYNKRYDSLFIVGHTGNTTENGYYASQSTNYSGNTNGIYFTAYNCVLMGAAWNDYAEFRQTKENIEPGRVVKENGDGTLSLTTMRLEKGCEIVSDTYGFGIGKSDVATLPIASSGRVLAYPDKEPSLFTIGAPVCSGPNGTVSEMTEEEEAKYPSRIIGTVSEIPNYEVWHGANDVEVNGRIWIRIR